mmetsp:Transcript_11830/g.41430  ORF Transcript_11830/g.41430 Transcript_11830/m.41430 type:complete len:257 (-) Transcript_11830:370-1140(-)
MDMVNSHPTHCCPACRPARLLLGFAAVATSAAAAVALQRCCQRRAERTLLRVQREERVRAARAHPWRPEHVVQEAVAGLRVPVLHYARQLVLADDVARRREYVHVRVQAALAVHRVRLEPHHDHVVLRAHHGENVVAPVLVHDAVQLLENRRQQLSCDSLARFGRAARQKRPVQDLRVLDPPRAHRLVARRRVRIAHVGEAVLLVLEQVLVLHARALARGRPVLAADRQPLRLVLQPLRRALLGRQRVPRRHVLEL